MSHLRFSRRSSAQSNSPAEFHNIPRSPQAGASSGRFLGKTWEFWAVRFGVIGLLCLIFYNLGPFGVHGLPAVGLGFLMAMVTLLAELRMRRAEISGLMGGMFGVVVGLLASLLIALVISRTAEPEPTKSFLELAPMFALGYLGLAVGSSKAGDLRRIPKLALAEQSSPGLPPMKLLDTSALIDGRIADICETHFLDGTLGIPRFVLHELQLVADSSDSLKRQRGRRGLEVL
jgi:hypothetical protein